jgi:hypothetical protein
VPRWRSPGAPAGDIQHFQQEIRFSTGIRYEWKDSRNDPLFRWFQKHREALNTESSGDKEHVDLPHL